MVRVLLTALAVAGTAAHATAGAQGGVGAHALLDVPFVAQTPELCGGAAVAMVLRYWGARDVQPQDFADLVGPHDGGIRTGTLATAVRDRGWQAMIVPAADGTARARVRSEIDRGRPLIALIEVAPRTYHYVVVVGSTEREVVLHDPARAPFRVALWEEFDRAWAAAGRWMLLALPPIDAAEGLAPRRPAPDRVAGRTQTPSACGAFVEHAVRLAEAGERDAAAEALQTAARLCPQDAAPWRELAGLRFSEARWAEAAAFAKSAARLDPMDAYTWQLIASSRYIAGDFTAALDAWNRAGEPHIDEIHIHGAGRTPHPIVVRAIGLQPRQLLTSTAFGRALRRLGELPVASSPRMKYEPVADGLVRVDASIDERPLLPRGWMTFAVLGARSLFQHQVRVDVAGGLSAGEVAGGSWRWSRGRPRVALEFSTPAPGRLPGVLTVEWLWERQSYQRVAAEDPAVMRLTRRRAAVHLADWKTGWARWQAGIALDRFAAEDTAGLEATLDLRFAGDRLALVTSAGWWASLRGGDRFSAGQFRAVWRSTVDSARPSWSAVTEFNAASRLAPLDLWHGAGTGQGRGGLLRAHPLLQDGVFTGPVFGRVVARVTLEYARPVIRKMGTSLALAGFVDTARAWHRRDAPGSSPLFVDAGVGLRVHAPGQTGTIRVDIAHGLRGGNTTLSAGWGATWPR